MTTVEIACSMIAFVMLCATWFVLPSGPPERVPEPVAEPIATAA